MSWFPKFTKTKAVSNNPEEDELECHFQCRQCDQSKMITVLKIEYVSWNNGAFTQVAFPNLSNSDREMFISGTCDVCWAELFSSKE